MCDTCCILTRVFEAAPSDSHQNYLPVLALVRAMVAQERVELFAGDCPLEEVGKHLEDEDHFTVCHYFRCKSCSRFFFIGACIRGTPLYKILDSLSDVSLDKMLWGRYGSTFGKNCY